MFRGVLTPRRLYLGGGGGDTTPLRGLGKPVMVEDNQQPAKCIHVCCTAPEYFRAKVASMQSNRRSLPLTSPLSPEVTN